MGLDKWLKPEDDAKKRKKKSSVQSKDKNSEQAQNQSVKKKLIKPTKFMLICPNTKCKYQKIIMKKELTDNDKICPRCNEKMKVKEV